MEHIALPRINFELIKKYVESRPFKEAAEIMQLLAQATPIELKKKEDA